MDDFILPLGCDWVYIPFDLDKESVKSPDIELEQYPVGECQCGEIEQAMCRHLVMRRN